MLAVKDQYNALCVQALKSARRVRRCGGGGYVWAQVANMSVILVSAARIFSSSNMVWTLRHFVCLFFLMMVRCTGILNFHNRTPARGRWLTVLNNGKDTHFSVITLCERTWFLPYSFNNSSVILLLMVLCLFVTVSFAFGTATPKYFKNWLVSGRNSNMNSSLHLDYFFFNEKHVGSERKVSQIVCTFSHPRELFRTSRYLT